MANGLENWDPNSFLDDLPVEDTPGVKLLLNSVGLLIAGRGEGIHKVLKLDQHSLWESIDTLFPETSGNRGLREAHTSALRGDSQSCRQRVSSMDVAWELVPVDTKRGREVLALAIILTDDQLPVEETQELRKTDRTTGISTRQTLVTQAEETFNRQLDTQWAVLRLKISGMRRINQALGQNMGDHALHQAVGRIVRSLEEGERVGRVAGNEFILLIHHKGDDHTVERIQAMDLLFDEPVKVGLLQFMLHLNVGIARYPQDGSTAQDLDRRATIAFERTRRSGFHYSFFSLALEDHVLAYSWVPAEAQRALRECEFQLHYQPVVDTRTGETVSIGKPVAVNMTADTITAPDFLKRLDSALAQSKLPPNWLTLELTERVFSSPELAAEMVTVSTLSA